MSALDGRTDRLYRGLTARERIVLILAAANEEREADYLIRSTVPDGQAGAFNRLLDQLHGVNSILTPYLLVLEQEVAHAQTQLLMLSALCHSPQHGLPALAPSPGGLPADADLKEPDRLLRTLAERLRRGLPHLSGVLGAVDLVIDEVHDNLGGHDPLHPMLRDIIDRVRNELAELREHGQHVLGEVEVPDYDVQTLETLRTLVLGTGPRD